MFYRILQFYHGLFPRISSEDIRLVQSFLSAAPISLFEEQSPADQRHALDVAIDLLQNQTHLPSSQKSILIQAALLHDCGKTCYPLKIWQRIYIVLCAKLPYTLQKSLKALTNYQALSLPLTLAQEHPEWGAKLASQAGLNEEVVELIRYHHTPRSEAGKLLHAADNRH
ncbi:HD domain-containing protein [Desulfitobacterium sp.]|uniref:HD domain-containing protein n=1 Tax=Desulfitobacterium sp. TaxID=49981 RepID=UPI002C22C288|nr:HD domain-containing protein [Desulfitobacterium sp.]HVJ50504.1 HD domain-containing protein [Desulfitobacterium sp.]